MDSTKVMIALGYPLGKIEANDDAVYEVNIYNKLFRTDEFSYFIWKLCFNTVNLDEFYKTIQKNIPVEKIKEAITRLINERLVVCMDMTDTQVIYNQLKKYVLIRAGIGIGLLDSGKNEYLIKTENEVVVSENEYLVWIQADGRKSISEISEDFSHSKDEINDRISFEQVLEAILFLYSRGLIFFIEEKL